MPVSIDEQTRKDAAESVGAAGRQQNPNKGFSSANPPEAAQGLSTGLQPGGTRPGGGPGAGVGSIGAGGGQTADEPTGSLKQDGR
jgi:hypothetical protein